MQVRQCLPPLTHCQPSCLALCWDNGKLARSLAATSILLSLILSRARVICAIIEKPQDMI